LGIELEPIGGFVMFEAFEKTDFMNALKKWDSLNKRVKCVYRQSLYEFDIVTQWRSDFKVHAGMILEGEWYVEK
jgi:hypothetical protein